MKIWEFETRSPYYELLRDGKKIYEGRVPDPSRESKRYYECKVGDVVKIVKVDAVSGKRVSDAKKLKFEIEKVSQYSNLDDLFKNFDYKLLDPLADSVDDLKNTILNFPGYSDRIKKHGFILVQLR